MPALKHLSQSMVAAVALTSAAAAYAADTGPMTMKPKHGISFDVGTKRGVSYFLSENGRCKLTFVLAEAISGDDVPSDVPRRFEVAIDAGKSARLDADGSRSLEFACGASAQAMTVTPSERLASSRPAR